MLLALTGSSRIHKIWYLDIRYLIKHISDNKFYFNKFTKTARKGNLGPPTKYLNFNSNKKLCVCCNIDQYLEKTQQIQNGENKL